jgi:hypothetical protein
VLERKRKQWQLSSPSYVAGVAEKKKAITTIVAFFCGGCCKEEEGNNYHCSFFCFLLCWCSNNKGDDINVFEKKKRP